MTTVIASTKPVQFDGPDRRRPIGCHNRQPRSTLLASSSAPVGCVYPRRATRRRRGNQSRLNGPMLPQAWGRLKIGSATTWQIAR